jgi:hypothetical protein
MTVEQQSIWLDEALTDGPSRYLESWVLRLTGQVDARGVDWAWAQLVRRHEGLRSHYVLDGDELVQRVLPADGMPGLAHRTCAVADLDAELLELVRRPMDLATAPIQGTLLRLASDDVVLAVQWHHIAADDWAVHLLEREFEECYRVWLAGRAVSLPPAPQPGPYAQEQRRTRPTPAVRDYWKRRLADLPAGAARSLPPDRPGADRPSHAGGQLRFALESVAAKDIATACRALRVTPFVLFAAATGALLAAGTGASDLLVGTAVSRRWSGELDRMVACLSQVMPLCLRVDPGRSFAELTAEVKRAVNETMAHGDIPVAELTRHLRRPGAGAAPLARTVLVLDDDAAGLDLPGITAERLHVPSGAAKYDMLLTLVAQPRGYQGFLDYASDRYTERAARGLTDQLAALIQVAIRDPHRPLSRLLPGP